MTHTRERTTTGSADCRTRARTPSQPPLLQPRCLPTTRLYGISDEGGQLSVEVGMALHGVSESFEHCALRIELLLQHVADRIERWMVRPGHDQLRKGRCGQCVERYLGLPWAAFDGKCLRALLELGRQRRGWIERGANRRQEPPQKRLGVVGPTARVELDPACRERRGGRIVECNSSRGRFDDRERSGQLRPQPCGEERDHAPIRMPDQVISRAEQACDEMRVLLEIDAIDRRIGRKAGSVDDQELELLAQRKLPTPGRTPSKDTPMDEHEPLHARILSL